MADWEFVLSDTSSITSQDLIYDELSDHGADVVSEREGFIEDDDGQYVPDTELYFFQPPLKKKKTVDPNELLKKYVNVKLWSKIGYGIKYLDETFRVPDHEDGVWIQFAMNIMAGEYVDWEIRSTGTWSRFDNHRSGLHFLLCDVRGDLKQMAQKILPWRYFSFQDSFSSVKSATAWRSKLTLGQSNVMEIVLRPENYLHQGSNSLGRVSFKNLEGMDDFFSVALRLIRRKHEMNATQTALDIWFFANDWDDDSDQHLNHFDAEKEKTVEFVQDYWEFVYDQLAWLHGVYHDLQLHAKLVDLFHFQLVAKYCLIPRGGFYENVLEEIKKFF